MKYNEGLGSIRTKKAPKKTIKAYKLMRLVDGKLYPLFIDSSVPTEIGVWYDADSTSLDSLRDKEAGFYYLMSNEGDVIRKQAKKPTKTEVEEVAKMGLRYMYVKQAESKQRRYGGYKQYYNVGINGSGVVSPTYAIRPGWHAGSLPTMRQIGKGSNKDKRDDSFVWTEVELSADVDYNPEAQRNPDKDIPDHIPEDGYYMKATNADKKKSQADLVGWYVAGAMKINRIISDKEARQIIDQFNAKHPEQKKVEYDYERESGKEFDAEKMALEGIKTTSYNHSSALDLLHYIVFPEDKSKRNSYTIGEDGKLYRGGEYAKIQYDTRCLLWRLDLPYDDVCDKINMVRCNPNCMKSNNEMYIPMPVACIDGYFYFRNTRDVTSFIVKGDSFIEEYDEDFPLDEKYWVEKYEKEGNLYMLFLKLREYYSPFLYLDIADIKKILDKIDSVKFLKSIHEIFVYLLEKSKGADTTVKPIEFAINKRIGEVKDGETFINRLIDQSKKIFVDKPEFKPKNDIKYYLKGFISNNEENHLNGVYHDGEEGYAVASDGYILAAVSSAYDENIKGKLIYPNGEVEEVKYPHWKRVIPEKKYLTKIDLDINQLWIFAQTLDKQNKIKAGSLYDGSTPTYKFNRFEINIGGEWVDYEIKPFLKFISLANRLGNGHLYCNPNKKKSTALYFITEEEKPSYILIQPCMTELEYEGNPIVADYHNETYCLYEFFYQGNTSEDKDKRRRIAKAKAKALLLYAYAQKNK